LQIDAAVRLTGDALLQGLDGARFADPRLADQCDDLALPGTRQGPSVEHQPHFVRAADERHAAAGAARGEAGHNRSLATHTPGRHRMRESFQFVIADRFDLKQSAQQMLRRLADEYGVRRGERLKPGGEIRRFAYDSAFLRDPSPVAMPTRACRRVPSGRSMPRTSARMPIAARTARSAASSKARGKPK
jgi:hypothetical protein